MIFINEYIYRYTKYISNYYYPLNIHETYQFLIRNVWYMKPLSPALLYNQDLVKTRICRCRYLLYNPLDLYQYSMVHTSIHNI